MLQGCRKDELASVHLTASGGPFLNYSDQQLDGVTPELAVKHPRWKMGKKISVDSSTLVNKALEVIEAKWLFGLEPNQIEVVIHPEHLIHSFVELRDGTLLAQLAVPDMKGPIAYALNFPDGRIPGVMERLDLTSVGQLTFSQVNDIQFPAVRIAKQCLGAKGCYSAAFNIANEVAVESFLNNGLRYRNILRFIEEFLGFDHSQEPQSVEELMLVVEQLKQSAESLILKWS